ncbi:MFS transporter PCFT/HCP family solute carrier family 46 (folate transporter) member 1 [Microdochium nivale]|nr:MFS transporter PCFT/HCP family solute carrier family 46 (folate transporter) member 1 [Microdochium nivale]
MAVETTPLLAGLPPKPATTATATTTTTTTQQQPKPASLSFPPTLAVFLAGFLISASFGLTQTPIQYAFQQMVCEDYYAHHPPFAGPGDRCDLPAISSGSSAQYAILCMCTVFFSIANLFFTGWQMRTLGAKKALLVQNFFPILRVTAQSIAITVGGAAGITLMQLGQGISIVGGPAGYILVLNTIIAEIVDQSQRTNMFGMLQGYCMLGNALGFLAGGTVSDRFGVVSPFRLGAVSLSTTLVFCTLCVPSVHVAKGNAGLAKKNNKKKRKSNPFIASFIDPIRALRPQRLRLKDGRIVTHYGVTMLAVGIFVGVLATSFVGNLLQQYSMYVFRFDASRNGSLMALSLIVRGLFLMFIFPIIISKGRKWFSTTKPPVAAPHVPQIVIPTQPLDFDPIPPPVTTSEEPVQPPPPPATAESGQFDLFFLRYSYLVDGVITMCAAFITDDWHFYLMAVLLPFASGSYAASKGVLTEMIPESRKVDALQGMTLVESLATVSTLGLFGGIFSSLLDIGKAELTFFVNAAIAILAIIILLFSKFPPEGSEVLEDEDEEENEDQDQDEASPTM